MSIRSFWILLSLLIISIASGHSIANVSISRVDFNGWKDSYMMRNDTTTLIYVPQIGRIMYYGLTNSDNVLWVNPDVAGKSFDPASLGKNWVNFGGDKLWPAPQSRWGWPPSPTIDRGGSRVVILSGNRLLATGVVDEALGIGFMREISLDPKNSKVTIKNTLVNHNKLAVEWAVWEVAQVDDPDEVVLPVSDNPKFTEKYHALNDAPLPLGMATLVGREVHFKRSPVASGKIGSDSTLGFIRGTFKRFQHPMTFTLSARREAGKTYPDDDCSLEIYGNADPAKYVEMEILSPITKIEPKKSYSFTTRWELKTK